MNDDPFPQDSIDAKARAEAEQRMDEAAATGTPREQLPAGAHLALLMLCFFHQALVSVAATAVVNVATQHALTVAEAAAIGVFIGWIAVDFLFPLPRGITVRAKRLAKFVRRPPPLLYAIGTIHFIVLEAAAIAAIFLTGGPP